MIFFLTATASDRDRFSRQLPAALLRYKNPSAVPYCYGDGDAALVLQELGSGGYTIRMDLIVTGTGMDMDFVMDAAGMSLVFVLEGSLAFTGEGGLKELTRGNYYLCYFPPHISCRVSYPAGTCQLLQVDVTGILDGHTTGYPPLEEIKAKMEDASCRDICSMRQGAVDYRIRQLIDGFLKGGGTPWEMELGVHSLAAALVRLYATFLQDTYGDAGKQPRTHKKLEKVRTYICTSLEKPLRMRQLAVIFGGSVSDLNRQYRQNYHESLRDYIHRQKMELSILLLRDGRITVNEVAEMTGYNNANNFTRAFSTYFGKTPSSARKDAGGEK